MCKQYKFPDKYKQFTCEHDTQAEGMSSLGKQSEAFKTAKSSPKRDLNVSQSRRVGGLIKDQVPPVQTNLIHYDLKGLSDKT